MFKSMFFAVVGCTKLFLNKLRHDAVSAYAANAAFFILVSIFPFLILMISAVHAVFPEASFALPEISRGIPDQVMKYLSDVLEEAETVATGTVLSVAVISTLWAASRGLFAIMHGLNTIDGTDETRSYIFTRSLAIIYTIGLIVTLILTFVFLIFGNKIYHFFANSFPILEKLDGIVRIMRYILGAIILTSFFTILYTFVPNRRSKIRYELPGAICCTTGWLGFSAIYSVYIDHFGGHSVYGSLSAIVLLMLWLYFCMYILLIGAEINKLIRPFREQSKKHQ